MPSADFSNFTKICPQQHFYTSQNAYCLCGEKAIKLICKFCGEATSCSHFAHHLKQKTETISLHILVVQKVFGKAIPIVAPSSVTLKDFISWIPLRMLGLKSLANNLYDEHLESVAIAERETFVRFYNSDKQAAGYVCYIPRENKYDYTHDMFAVHLNLVAEIRRDLSNVPDTALLKDLIKEQVQQARDFKFAIGSFPSFCSFKSGKCEYEAYIGYNGDTFYKYMQQHHAAYYELFMQHGLYAECLFGYTMYDEQVPITLPVKCVREPKLYLAFAMALAKFKSLFASNSTNDADYEETEEASVSLM